MPVDGITTISTNCVELGSRKNKRQKDIKFMGLLCWELMLTEVMCFL